MNIHKVHIWAMIYEMSSSHTQTHYISHNLTVGLKSATSDFVLPKQDFPKHLPVFLNKQSNHGWSQPTPSGPHQAHILILSVSHTKKFFEILHGLWLAAYNQHKLASPSWRRGQLFNTEIANNCRVNVQYYCYITYKQGRVSLSA